MSNSHIVSKTLTMEVTVDLSVVQGKVVQVRSIDLPSPEEVMYALNHTVKRANEVLAFLETGEWALTKNLPCEYMTDEANRRHAWSVARQVPPFADANGRRSWSAPEAILALELANKELGL